MLRRGVGFLKDKAGSLVSGAAGLGGAMTGGLGLTGLMGSSVGAIGGLGAGAMATSGALLAGAGAVGYGVGTLANMGMSAGFKKMSGGKVTSLGDWIYQKVHGSDEERMKEQNEKMQSEIAAKYKGIMTPAAYESLGGDQFDVKQFMKRRNKDIIGVKQEGGNYVWMTSEEAGKSAAEDAEKDVPPTEPKKATATSIPTSIPTVPLEQMKTGTPTPAGTKTAAVNVKTATLPGGLPDATHMIATKEAEDRQRLDKVSNVLLPSRTPTAGAAPMTPSNRQPYIDDYGIHFINSVLFG